MGVAAAAGAFFLWGLFPVYWKLLGGVAPIELIAHRVVWSLALLLVILPFRGRMALFLAAWRDRKLVGLHLASGVLLSVNWLTYVYAVLSAQIVESSLGYFLNPLFNVLLGALVLRERLRPLQWTAVGLAAAGMAVQLVNVGRVPWIALVLASSFALYGLLRKRGPLGSLTGLAVETALLAPVAAGYLVWLAVGGAGALGHAAPSQQVLVLTTGIATSTPLLLFAAGARVLRLSTVGLIQYLAPSLQLLVGVALYHEPFGSAQVTSFAFIWAGLALYTADSLRAQVPGAAASPASARGSG